MPPLLTYRYLQIFLSISLTLVKFVLKMSAFLSYAKRKQQEAEVQCGKIVEADRPGQNPRPRGAQETLNAAPCTVESGSLSRFTSTYGKLFVPRRESLDRGISHKPPSQLTPERSISHKPPSQLTPALQDASWFVTSKLQGTNISLPEVFFSHNLSRVNLYLHP